MAYLIWNNKWDVSQAFKYIKQRRFIMPNTGFIAQLRQYEKQILTQSIEPYRPQS